MIASALADWSTLVATVFAAISAIGSVVVAYSTRSQWRKDREERREAARRRQRSILVALRDECAHNAQWWHGRSGMIERLTMPIWETSRTDLSDIDTEMFVAVNAAYQGMQRTHTRMAGFQEWLEKLDKKVPGHHEEHVAQLNGTLRDDFMTPTAERWKAASKQIDRVLSGQERALTGGDTPSTDLSALAATNDRRIIGRP